MIKFWDPQAQYRKHKVELDQAIHEVLESGQWVLGAGDLIPTFEAKFAEFVGKKHAIMVRNGTSALYLAYRALGVKEGDEVITTPNTFIATIDQIAALGGTPVLVDTGPQGLIDPHLVKEAISYKTKLIVPVHMEGKVADMERIGELAKFYDLAVVEDAAQALGAKGVGEYSIAQCYSLYPAKILGSFGNAGMITTDDDQLAERLRMFRCNSNIGKNPDMSAEFGMNMEPENRDAAWLLVKLKYLPETLARRKEIAERYLKELNGLPMYLPSSQKGRVWQDFMVSTSQRNELQAFLKGAGIEALVPNPRIPNTEYDVLSDWQVPKSVIYIKNKLALPCNDTITDGEVGEIIAKIKEFYGK